jgi:hypothetical protein
VGPTPLRDELRAARRALEEVQVHVRSLRSWAAGSRLASRLESDVRRVVEDLDDLDAETGARGTAAGAGPAGPRWTPYPDAHSSGARPAPAPIPAAVPVPVPSRHGEPEFQPECDDEGLGGGWQADATTPDAGRRRGAQSRGNGHGSGRAR